MDLKMHIQPFTRFGAAAFLAALVSGCSLIAADTPDAGAKKFSSKASAPARGNDCKWNRSSCIHEGAYEAKERDYAEEEAKRLNRIALETFRRNAGR